MRGSGAGQWEPMAAGGWGGGTVGDAPWRGRGSPRGIRRRCRGNAEAGRQIWSDGGPSPGNLAAATSDPADAPAGHTQAEETEGGGEAMG